MNIRDNKNTVDRKELMSILEISKSTLVGQWHKKPVPIPYTMHKNKTMYCISDVYDWLSMYGTPRHLSLMEDKTKCTAPVKKHMPVKKLKNKESCNIKVKKTINKLHHDLDVYAVFDKLFDILNGCIERLTDSVGSEQTGNISVEVNNIKGLMSEVRQFQKDLIKIDIELKTVIQFEEVKKYFGPLMVMIRTDLLTLPFSLADELAALSDPKATRLLLEKGMKNSLRHVADNLNVDDIVKQGDE